MDKGSAGNRRAKQPQPKKPPDVEWLGGPPAENGPGDIPEQHEEALLHHPRRFIRGQLKVGCHLFMDEILGSPRSF